MPTLMEVETNGSSQDRRCFSKRLPDHLMGRGIGWRVGQAAGMRVQMKVKIKEVGVGRGGEKREELKKRLSDVPK